MGGMNLYGFCGNDPINSFDVYGMAKGDWWDPRSFTAIELLQIYGAGVQGTAHGLKNVGVAGVELVKSPYTVTKSLSQVAGNLSTDYGRQQFGQALYVAQQLSSRFASDPNFRSRVRTEVGDWATEYFTDPDKLSELFANVAVAAGTAGAGVWAKSAQGTEKIAQLMKFLEEVMPKGAGRVAEAETETCKAANATPMFSRTTGGSMDSAELGRIKAAFERAGHAMDVGSDEGVRRLDFFNVEASTLGDLITLRPNPSRSAVFEELIHSAQNRLGRNDGSMLSRVLNEIEAQEKLIRFRRQYGIPRAETQQTMQALRDYRLQLQMLQGN